MKENYDVIVIGSGIGGLSAAGLTAKAGKCVLVVDQRPGPGGVCYGFERDGIVTNQLKAFEVADSIEFLCTIN